MKLSHSLQDFNLGTHGRLKTSANNCISYITDFNNMKTPLFDEAQHSV